MYNVADDQITKTVTNKLATRGLTSPCRVTVQTSHGQVTLSGTVQHAHQIGAATAAVSGMSGVRRVINQIIIKPPLKR